MDRLRILALLLRGPGLTVSQVAARLSMSVSRASAYLRVLESRSLLTVRRQGRWVFYEPAKAGGLMGVVRALEVTLGVGKKSLRLAFALITAFTHPRRIEIYKALSRGPQKLPQIVHDTGIPASALLRHLDKLRRRGFVAQERRRGAYSVTSHPDQLGRVLAQLATS